MNRIAHTSLPSPSDATIARARLGASLLFIIDGGGFGIWAALLPTLQTRLQLDSSELASAMFGMVAGAMIAMSSVGRLIGKIGSGRMLAIIAPLFALALCGPVLAPSLGAVIAAATVFGLLKGSFDVAANSQALTIEKATKRSIMSSIQACWSLGGLGAALIVGIALKSNISPLVITLLGSVLFCAASVWCGRHLLPDPAQTTNRTRGGILQAAILPVGFLAFVALFTEGVMMDWSAVYAANVAGAAPWLAPLAFGVFCSAMATGRLFGDQLIMKIGAAKVLRLSGSLTVIGLILIVTVRLWPATFAGLLACGLGLANLVPIFLKTAGTIHPGGAARGVAAISSIGYIGFLAGPPLIGWLGEWLGLPLAFAAVALAASVIALWGPALASPAPDPSAKCQPSAPISPAPAHIHGKETTI